MRTLGLILAASATLSAQTVEVRSEYWKPGSQGREILSPAVARNGYFSLQAIVSVPAGQRYSLFVAQNPVESFAPSIYRVSDALSPTSLPVQETSQGDSVFWIDLWIPPNTPVQRVRVEVQLNVADRWIIYPMEFRVVEDIYPEPSAPWCGEKKAAPGSQQAAIQRNRAQDAALARSRPDFNALRAEVCALSGHPESYLPIRTRLLRPD